MIDFVVTHWISIVGTIVGLIFLYLEYKASIFMWIASTIMAAFYIYIFYTTQLYASMGIYIYFFLASIYGWIAWQRKRKQRLGEEIIIIRVPSNALVPIIGGILVCFGLICIILFWYSQNSIYITLGDALATALNIVALWMASRRWAEQWLLLIPANFISSILLFAQNDILSSILFFTFFVVSIFGYFKWKKMATKGKEDAIF